MSAILKILLLEDTAADAELMSRQLTRAKLLHQIKRVETRADFLRGLEEFEPDIILSDHSMPGYDGLSALRDTRERQPATPFIFVSGTLGEARAVESLKQGASDYVVKGDLMRLPPAIERAMAEKKLRREHEMAEQLLHASEAKFKLLAEQAPIGIMLTDAQGRFTFCNEEWASIAECKVEQIINTDPSALFHPEDRERVVREMQAMFADRQSHDITYRLVRPSGEIRWVTARGAGQYDGKGHLFGFIGLLTDITEQRLAELKITRLSRIQEVLSGINAAIVRVNSREQLCRDACQIAINKGKFRMAWIALADSESTDIQTVEMAGDNAELLDQLKKTRPNNLNDTSPIAKEVMRTRKPRVVNRSTEAEELSHLFTAFTKAEIASIAYLPLCLGEQLFGILVLCSDVKEFFTDEEMKLLSELTEDIAFAIDHLDKEDRLNYLAYYDSLSGLPNRTLFFDHLQLAIGDAEHEKQNVTVLIINIERFRHINESFGESVGDTLLKEVAQRLKAWIGGPDRIGHLGGDNFGIFIPRMPDLVGLPSRIERKFDEWLKQPFIIQGHEIVVSLKIGAAFFPADGEDAEIVFQNANAALKQAKLSGERVLFYSQDFNARAAEHLRLENRLRRAIDQHELVLHYQPKICLSTHRIKSVEALIRWQDKERGLIPPNEFIPVMEETGLIYEAGLWALQQAHVDHQHLRGLFSAAPRIAVNVSALQLRRKTFNDEILSVIGRSSEQHGIDIEITESLLMENIEENIDKLKDLRSHDVHIAIDDFGTGYSSLAYIAKLPIDILKIDRSFVSKMMGSRDDQAIVSTIITLAHSLDMRVVAEGVESAAQAEKLKALKCDEAQGFFFCRPLPLNELVQRLATDDGHVVLKH